jgi:hypothetical protein
MAFKEVIIDEFYFLINSLMFNVDSEMILDISSFIFLCSFFIFEFSFSFNIFISEIFIDTLNISYVILINNIGIPENIHRNILNIFMSKGHTESLIAINVLIYAKGK